MAVDNIARGMAAAAMSGGGGGGSSGGVLVVNMNPDTFTLDKTFAEIKASPAVVILHQAQAGEIYRAWVTAACYDTVYDNYGVTAITTVGDDVIAPYYIAESENDYPVYD